MSDRLWAHQEMSPRGRGAAEPLNWRTLQRQALRPSPRVGSVVLGDEGRWAPCAVGGPDMGAVRWTGDHACLGDRGRRVEVPHEDRMMTAVLPAIRPASRSRIASG